MVEVSVSHSAVEENSRNALSFTVTLSESSVEAVTLDYRTLLNGTATDEDLYYRVQSAQNNGTLTFSPGETSKEILIYAKSDYDDEVDEAITLELSNLSENAEFQSGGLTERAFGVIRDDDGVSSDLAVFVSDPVMVEGNGPGEVAFDILLSRPADSNFTLTYRTTDLSATASQDYTATTGSIDFLAGQSEARVVVPLIGDANVETSERFALIVEPPVSPQIDTSGAVGTALILDDDNGPVVTIESQPAIEGSSNSVRFTVSLSEPPIDAVSMSFRTKLDQTANDDDLYYSSAGTQNNGTLTFAPGQTTQTIEIFLRSDYEDERDESFTVELFNLSDNASFAGGGNTLATKGIALDDDGVGPELALFVSDPTLVEGDSGQKLAVFDLVLSRPAEASITIEFETADITATAGSDYIATSGSLTFAAGQDRASVSVPVLGDTDAEATKTFALNVTTPPTVSVDQKGLSGEAVILDDDNAPGPVISIDQSTVAIENSSDPLNFVVTLSEASEEPVTVSFQTGLGSASDSDLYYTLSGAQNSGTLTFNPGETSANILIASRSDYDDERDESLFLTLSDAVGGTLAGGVPTLSSVGFIQDDDGVGLNIALAGAPVSVAEPTEGEKLIEIPVSLSRAPEEDLTFDVAVAGGTATNGIDFQLLENSITFAAGQVNSGVQVSISGDLDEEGLETFLLNFAAQSGSDFAGTVLDQTVTIRNTAPPHVNTLPEGEVTISGDANVGEALTAETDTISDTDGLGAFSYQWLRDGTPISGATTSVYTLTDDDLGAQVSVRVSYRDGEGTDEILESATSDPVETNVDDFPLMGTPGPDVLKGTDRDDTIFGLEGDDRILGEAGNDVIGAGDGADTINAGDGDDEITAGASDADLRDVIYAGEGNDMIDAGHGNDLVYGQGGNDTIAGGFGVDELQGQDGDDIITGSAFSDLVFGGDGNDFVNGGFGHDRINGGSGADRFYHLGIEDHGSDWVQDFNSAEGDVLLFGSSAVSAANFQVNFAHTASAEGERAGDDNVEEAFVIYKPTGQIIWALVDGAGQDEINIQIGSEAFDLL